MNGTERLKKAIDEKRAEIEALSREPAGDALQEVVKEKKARKLQAEITGLEAALQAASYRPPEPTDAEELLQCLQKYREEHRARIAGIEESLAELDRKDRQIEEDLNQAAMDADATATIELSGRRDDNRAVRKHLQEMLERAREIPVYPAGAIMDEWAAICRSQIQDWENCVLELETLAKAYMAAADALIRMDGTIKSVRDKLNREAGARVCGTFFTYGKDWKGLVIDKPYHNRIAAVFEPAAGRPA